MGLKLYNSMTRSKEEFKPARKGEVGVYVCGPTVYGHAHLGHAKSYVSFDVLVRYLCYLGYSVTYVQNITDVGHLTDDADEGEDKLAVAAKKEKKHPMAVAEYYTRSYFEDMDRLNCVRPDISPRASGHITEQIELVKTLLEKGYAYEAGGSVYFEVSKFADYGKFSGQKLEEKKEGARVEYNPEKRNPTDFALWKFSPSDQKRQMEWMSPWGKGFPGWHVECSAMSSKYLRQPFDIHTGGIDHIPVHHENEIAQSVAAENRPLAHYWMHNDFLLVDGKRMGKSEGNAYTLQDIVKKDFDPLAFRYYCLGTHYRAKMNFTWDGLESAQNALQKLQEEARKLPKETAEDTEENHWREKFEGAIGNDLNTPQALAVLWEMLKSELAPQAKSTLLSYMDRVFALGLHELKGAKVSISIPEEVRALAEQRKIARLSGDWKESDILRNEIARKGWRIEDKIGRAHV